MANTTHLRFPQYYSTTTKIGCYMKGVQDGHWKLATMQRNDSTWPKSHYKELIESIFNNILTSPFIGSQKDPRDPLKVSILDGGHRTEAIRRFYNDEIKITCPQSGEEKLWSELSDQTRAIFNTKPCITIVYEGLTPLHEETLFFRVNNSLPLHPGETVNGHITVPMCVLARELGEHYADVMRSGLKQSITNSNARGESSNVALMILQNFHRGHIENGQRPSAMEKVKNTCERLRSVVIDEQKLRDNVSALFRIIQKRKRDKYEFHLIASIQAMMQNYNIASNAGTWTNGMSRAERIDTFAGLISDFLYEIENPDLVPTELFMEYRSITRATNGSDTGVNNPGLPRYCVKRAQIFANWLEFKEIDLTGLIVR